MLPKFPLSSGAGCWVRMTPVLFLIPDPHNLKISCRVNGEIVQSSNTNQMVFKTEDLIAWVSQ